NVLESVAKSLIPSRENSITGSHARRESHDPDKPRRQRAELLRRADEPGRLCASLAETRDAGTGIARTYCRRIGLPRYSCQRTACETPGLSSLRHPVLQAIRRAPGTE